MDDTISRQQTIDAILDMSVEHRVSWKDAVIDVIDDLPSAQPDHKCGRWEHKRVDYERYNVYGTCSECKERSRINNFCPYCGTRMVIA